MNNKSLIVYEKGFFYKIKMFFKNIFNKEKLQESNDYKYTDEQEKKTSFTDKIKVKPDFEKEKLLKIQKDYEDGLIKEEDMTQEQVKEIENLYIEQITKLRETYMEYKYKTATLRKKLVTNGK